MSAFLYIGRNQNNESGLNNHKHKISKLIPLDALGEYGIEKIYAGNGYNIYTDHKQHYWASGDNKNGQCGINKSQKTINTLTKIDYFKTHRITIKKVFVNISGCCTFWISNTNILYGNGWNKHNQLSIPNNYANVNTPTKLIFNSWATNILDIKSAFNYTIVLLKNGDVFSTSFSKYGGNGHRKNKYRKKTAKSGFKRIPINTKIKKIAAGYYHSLFLDCNGFIWCCGKNNYGQLGLGHNRNVKLLTPIPFFMRNGIQIKEIHCGGNYNIVSDVNDEIYAWGANNCGQCGVGHTENVNKPQRILLKDKIKYIKCGRNHCYLGTDRKNYLFGNNYWNQCIVSKEKVIKQPTLMRKQVQNVYLGCDNTTLIVDKYDDEKKECTYYNTAKEILKQQFASIPKESFTENGNRCYCEQCHTKRGDGVIYKRGKPRKPYALPIGFARFGLRVDDGFCKMHNAFEEWHACYHGTKQETVPKIFEGRMTLLKPGDVAIGGSQLSTRDGHIRKTHKRWNKYSQKHEMFDPNQIYVSPSVKYASHEVYAKWITCKHPLNHKIIKVQFVFQCRIRPGSYDIGQETIGATRNGLILDENFSNDEVEWYTKESVGIILHGLLLRFK